MCGGWRIHSKQQQQQQLTAAGTRTLMNNKNGQRNKIYKHDSFGKLS